MKIKTSELTGAALAWAVATANGDYPQWDAEQGVFYQANGEDMNYPNDWAQAGPIIERERIEVRYRVGVNMTATIDGQYAQTVAHTERPNPVLIAAMRCFVASKLGDEVDVPDELKGEKQ